MSLLVNIHKELRDFTLNINFETEGETLALLGATGSGRTAALRCIAGLDKPDRGRIELNGRVLYDSAGRVDLPPRKRRVGCLFPSFALFPHMTVRENLEAAALPLPKERRKQSVEDRLHALRLTEVETLYPRQLNDAQRQRAALARALAGEPECLLLDEPFSALDSYLRWQAELELGELLRSYQGDRILVTHDRDEVYHLCQSVCVIADGRSEEKTAVRDLMAVPRTVNAAVISGCKNFSQVQRVGSRQLKCLNWGVTLETTQEVNNICTTVGVRDYNFHIARSGEPNRFNARVLRVLDSTSTTVLLLAPEGGDAMIRMELPTEQWARLRNQTTVLLSVLPEHVMTLSGEL